MGERDRKNLKIREKDGMKIENELHWIEIKKDNFKKKIRISGSLTVTLIRGPVLRWDCNGRNSPLHEIREGGLSLIGSHGKGRSSGVLFRSESANRGEKFSMSKNFQLFSKPIFSVFQDSRIIFSEKKFSDFLVHYLESEFRYRNETPMGETPLYM